MIPVEEFNSEKIQVAFQKQVLWGHFVISSKTAIQIEESWRVVTSRI